MSTTSTPTYFKYRHASGQYRYVVQRERSGGRDISSFKPEKLIESQFDEDAWDEFRKPKNWPIGAPWRPHDLDDVIRARQGDPLCMMCNSDPAWHAYHCKEDFLAIMEVVADAEMAKSVVILKHKRKGYGVWATRHISQGELLGLGNGMVVPPSHGGGIDKPCNYDIGVENILYSDYGPPRTEETDRYVYKVCLYERGSWTRFMNHTCDESEINAVCTSEIIGEKRAIVLRALKDIPKDSELLWDYGPSYCKRLKCWCATAACRNPHPKCLRKGTVGYKEDEEDDKNYEDEMIEADNGGNDKMMREDGTASTEVAWDDNDDINDRQEEDVEYDSMNAATKRPRDEDTESGASNVGGKRKKL